MPYARSAGKLKRRVEPVRLAPPCYRRLGAVAADRTMAMDDTARDRTCQRQGAIGAASTIVRPVDLAYVTRGEGFIPIEPFARILNIGRVPCP